MKFFDIEWNTDIMKNLFHSKLIENRVNYSY